ARLRPDQRPPHAATQPHGGGGAGDGHRGRTHGAPRRAGDADGGVALPHRVLADAIRGVPGRAGGAVRHGGAGACEGAQARRAPLRAGPGDRGGDLLRAVELPAEGQDGAAHPRHQHRHAQPAAADRHAAAARGDRRHQPARVRGRLHRPAAAGGVSGREARDARHDPGLRVRPRPARRARHGVGDRGRRARRGAHRGHRDHGVVGLQGRRGDPRGARVGDRAGRRALHLARGQERRGRQRRAHPRLRAPAERRGL
ncbi:MAG: hypothetical protein AVDCRST_MAG68-1551, partial [uncultured Gemmatimonadetes bacterium]